MKSRSARGVEGLDVGWKREVSDWKWASECSRWWPFASVAAFSENASGSSASSSTGEGGRGGRSEKAC